MMTTKNLLVLLVSFYSGHSFAMTCFSATLGEKPAISSKVRDITQLADAADVDTRIRMLRDFLDTNMAELTVDEAIALANSAGGKWNPLHDTRDIILQNYAYNKLDLLGVEEVLKLANSCRTYVYRAQIVLNYAKTKSKQLSADQFIKLAKAYPYPSARHLIYELGSNTNP